MILSRVNLVAKTVALVCGHTILLLCGGSDDTDESGGLELAGCVTNILLEICDLLHIFHVQK